MLVFVVKKDPVHFSELLRTFYQAHCSQPPKITKVRKSEGQKQMLKLALQKEIYLCFVPLKKQKKGKKSLFDVKRWKEYLPGLKECPFPQDITITSWIKELFPKNVESRSKFIEKLKSEISRDRKGLVPSFKVSFHFQKFQRSRADQNIEFARKRNSQRVRRAYPTFVLHLLASGPKT